MPYYTYKCEKCGHEDSEIRNVEDRNNLKQCTKMITNETIIDDLESMEGYEIQVFCDGNMKLKIGNPPFKFKS